MKDIKKQIIAEGNCTVIIVFETFNFTERSINILKRTVNSYKNNFKYMRCWTSIFDLDRADNTEKEKINEKDI